MTHEALDCFILLGGCTLLGRAFRDWRVGVGVWLVVFATAPWPAWGATPHATGTVQVQAFEQDTAAGVQPLGTAVGLRRSSRRHVPLAPDPRLIPGAKMAVRGSWAPSGGDLVADPADPKGVRLLRPPYFTPALPLERLAVLPVYFPGTLAPTRTVASFASDYASLAAWISRSSYGRTTLTVEAHPWVAADRTLGEVACDFGAMVAMAIRLHPEVDYRAVSILDVVTPTIPWQQYNCLGHGGAGGALIGRWPVETRDGWVTVGQQITTEQYPASAHETGHCLGLQHANALACTPPGVPADIGPCANDEYGDLFDVMGHGAGDYSAARKQQLGWLDPATGPEQTLRVTTPGLYVLTPLGVPGQPGSMDVKGLQLPRSGAPPATWLWLDARAPVGNDWRLPDAWLAGVFLHGDLAHLHVTDRDPESEHYGASVPIQPGALLQLYPRAGESWGDVALPVGQSFVDPPWRVTVVSRTTTSTVVEVAAAASTPRPTATPQRPTGTPTAHPPGANCCWLHTMAPGGGCGDPTCEACVCAEDPTCCTGGVWNANCVEIAAGIYAFADCTAACRCGVPTRTPTPRRTP